MTKRIISAVVAMLILFPLLMIGGMPFAIAIYILGLLGLHEFLKIKESKKELPTFISFISYIVLTFLIFSSPSKESMMFMIDFRIVAGLFLVFLLPTVLYHDREKYSIVDGFYLIGSIFFLGTSFSLMVCLRELGLSIVLYLFLITVITDIYAFITGKLVGKHKLIEDISPKKTWEGTIGGTLMGVIIGTLYYHFVVDASLSILIVIAMTLFLSILGQFGDLVFSAIKRYYGKKDFSNIMPGHGGILDRCDSLIFVVFGFMFFISII